MLDTSRLEEWWTIPDSSNRTRLNFKSSQILIDMTWIVTTRNTNVQFSV